MSYLQVLMLAWPVILSNLTIPLLGSIDIAMMGHTGSQTLLASAAIGAMLFDFIFWGFGFLRMSTTGLTAQTPNDKMVCLRGLVLSVVLGLFLLLSKTFFYHGALYFLETTPEIKAALASYYYIRIYAAIPTLCNYVIIGYLFGQQNTKAALYLVILTNLSQIGLDFIMVSHLALGIKGLGVASVLAQTIGMGLGLVYLHHRYALFNTRQTNLFDLKTFKRLFSINRDIFLRTFCLLITFAVFTREGTKLGPTVVAANAILLNLQQLTSYALDGFTIACESLVGKAYGEKNKRAFIQCIQTCFSFCLAAALGFSFLFFFLGDLFISWMNTIPAVQITAHALLKWIIILPLISVGSFVLDGVFIGATWTKEMRNTMILSSLIFLASCYALLPFKANGLWLAFCFFMLSRCVFLAERLHKKLVFLT